MFNPATLFVCLSQIRNQSYNGCRWFMFVVFYFFFSRKFALLLKTFSFVMSGPFTIVDFKVWFFSHCWRLYMCLYLLNIIVILFKCIVISLTIKTCNLIFIRKHDNDGKFLNWHRKGKWDGLNYFWVSIYNLFYSTRSAYLYK